jgi:hypothetical protein
MITPLPIDALEVIEPERTEDVKAGTFELRDKYGNTREREFYVRTVTDDESENHQSIRESDLNLQMMQAWEMLRDEGVTNIRYRDVRPSPFF